jgi:uncharacterized protein YggE
MKAKLFILSFFVLHCCMQAQNPDVSAKRFIEVTGMSETEVTPDEIFITITLQERSENREKLTIQKQEESLMQSVKDLGIGMDNLVLSSADADYRKLRSFSKDVVVSKVYILKVASAEKLAAVYQQLDKINAFDAFVSRVNHSKIIELTRENRVKAMKASKEKATYLLAAIGEQAGEALQVSEVENFIDNPVIRNRMGMAKMNMLLNSADNLGELSGEISFRKIKIRSSYMVKYEIQNK